ncbi:Rtf2 RING-finger-domain-containing protein [Radiomyces spectabilis]|uniref:Rtf2 RING-finger-domain-containing protein n=1 Tax=Radiomyces spectabilis TaxID=64574 RepID=UPI00221F071D|nr:Rtf2 RING-finger-domain-containing protein [Radiomyces spectabilis]KAI8371719.1 Rtf2 RING-finger-domain-containing protein [Radiomyces spectabilis]
MGNDGGSIPRRIELVKEKQKDIRLNPDLERLAAWFHCALSKQPLEPPIVADALGKLYNQDAVIEYLLDKSAYGDADKICSHIHSMKDTTKLNLTPNPAYSEAATGAATMGNLEQDIKARFICPISMKEMNGKHRFVYFDTCGCVIAEQSLKEIPSKECVTCGKPFENENVIVINPQKEELEGMKAAMEAKKAKAKAAKKAKKAAKAAMPESDTSGAVSPPKDKKRKHHSESPEGPGTPKKLNTSGISSSSAAVVMSKVAQELAEKHKKQELSSAVKSIYAKKDVKGNYLTMGTFNRYA